MGTWKRRLVASLPTNLLRTAKASLPIPLSRFLSLSLRRFACAWNALFTFIPLTTAPFVVLHIPVSRLAYSGTVGLKANMHDIVWTKAIASAAYLPVAVSRRDGAGLAWRRGRMKRWRRTILTPLSAFERGCAAFGTTAGNCTDGFSVNSTAPVALQGPHSPCPSVQKHDRRLRNA